MSEPTSTPGFDLVAAVERKIQQVRTRSLDVSFNELLDMYNNAELKIDPEYQRLFRWDEGQQSRFIESLILEMPVPPIYVIEIDEGVYELIDGLQRISSYLNFRGNLERQSDGSPQYLTLRDCDIVPELNNKTFPELPRLLELKLKRNFIRMEVLRKESDRRLRYHMFKRLNTGGERLSDQEIRNCTVRLLGNRFNQFIINMSDYPDFKTCITFASQEKLDSKYDEELVLRFFAFKNNIAAYRHKVGEFLTDYMEQVTEEAELFDYDQEQAVFERTFSLLAQTLGEYSFSSVNAQGTPIASFASLHFEAIALGIQPIVPNVDLDDTEQVLQLRDLLWEIKKDEAFRRLTTGGGKNSKPQLLDRISFVAGRLGAGDQ